MELERTSWHHAPEHRFVPGLTYMITGATLYKQHFYPTSRRLESLQSMLLEITTSCLWSLSAWSVFSNHYHLIGRAEEGAWPISRLIQRLHSQLALALSLEDGTPGRRVWYQYWDRYLTYSGSYYARLNYVSNNAVKHGLVSLASDYPYCSAGWSERSLSSATRRMVRSFQHDRIREVDDFDPIWQR